MKKTLSLLLGPLLLQIAVASGNEAPEDFKSRHLAIGLSRSSPSFSRLAIDSLGQGKLGQNPVLAQTNALAGLELKEAFAYCLKGQPVWKVTCAEKTLTLISEYAEGVAPVPFALAFDQKKNHATAPEVHVEAEVGPVCWVMDKVSNPIYGI